MSVEDLQTLGYTVARANERAYLVKGFGIELYVSVDDDEALTTLADWDAHKMRAFQINFPDQTTAVVALQDDANVSMVLPDPNDQNPVVEITSGGSTQTVPPEQVADTAQQLGIQVPSAI